MIETKLAHELRFLRRSPFNAVPHIENNQPIFHLQVMQISPTYFFTFLCLNSSDNWTLNLPTTNLFRIFHVGEIDDAHGAGSVVRQVNVMAVNEGTMHPAGHSLSVFGDWFGMSRIRGVVEGNSVLSIRGAFPGNNQNFSISGGADIVHTPRVDLDCVSQFRLSGIGDVIYEKMIRDG